jgi:hypothetical protein
VAAHTPAPASAITVPIDSSAAACLPATATTTPPRTTHNAIRRSRATTRPSNPSPGPFHRAPPQLQQK